MEEIEDKAQEAASFLKGLASPHRLMILCQMADGSEKSVSELMELVELPQTSVSQHLGRLKKEGIVDYRRDHRTLYYSIKHPAAIDIMSVMRRTFCDEEDGE